MHTTIRQQDETSPLLSDAGQHDEVSPLLARNAGQQNAPKPKAEPKHSIHHKKPYVFSVIILLLLAVDFAGCLLEAPQTDIFEKIICDKYYASALSSTERDCTVRDVQSELALVNELLRTINQLPSILLAIPYGILADRIGRRPVLILSMIGCCFQDILAKIVCWWPSVFPLRLVWLSSVGRFIGGGDAVASSMIYLMMADVFPQEKRADCFFKASATILLGEIIGIPLSAALMNYGSWIPYVLSLALSVVGLLIPIFLLPETLQRTSATGTEQQEDAGKNRLIFPRFRRWIHQLDQVRNQVFANNNVVLMLVAFFAATLGRQSTGFQLQYVRQRFKWTYAKASFLIALRGGVNLILLLALLPLLNRVLAAKRWTPRPRDLFITRISALSLALGAITIALAPHPFFAALGVSVMALGAGYASTARSLVTTMVEQNSTGALYTALAVTSGASGLVAGPLLALTFRWGVSLGPAASGVPFLFVATLFAMSWVAMQFVCLEIEHDQVADSGSPPLAEDRND